MPKDCLKLVLFAAGCVLTANSYAATGGISSVVVDPPVARITSPAGVRVKFTICGGESASTNCGLRIHYGTGESEDVKVTSKDGLFPKVLTKTYIKPGSYAIKVKGERVTTHLRCPGEATAVLKVESGPAPRIATPQSSREFNPAIQRQLPEMEKTQQKRYLIVIDKAKSEKEAEGKASQLTCRNKELHVKTQLAPSGGGYLVIQSGEAKSETEALLEAIRLKQQFGLNPTLFEIK